MFVEHFCDDYHNRDVTGNNTALKCQGRNYFCIVNDPRKRCWHTA